MFGHDYMLHNRVSRRANYIYKRGLAHNARRDLRARIDAEVAFIDQAIPQAQAAGDTQAVTAFQARKMELQQVRYENA